MNLNQGPFNNSWIYIKPRTQNLPPSPIIPTDTCTQPHMLFLLPCNSHPHKTQEPMPQDLKEWKHEIFSNYTTLKMKFQIRICFLLQKSMQRTERRKLFKTKIKSKSSERKAIMGVYMIKNNPVHVETIRGWRWWVWWWRWLQEHKNTNSSFDPHMCMTQWFLPLDDREEGSEKLSSFSSSNFQPTQGEKKVNSSLSHIIHLCKQDPYL